MIRPARLIKAAVVLLALGSLAVAAAPMVWTLAGHDTVIPPLASLSPQAPAAPRDIDTGAAMALAPFGAATVAQTANAKAPQQIDLTLLGVIVRDDPARSMALIGSPAGEANFRIGDDVAEGVTLAGVTAEYVMLDLAGDARRLGFYGAEQPVDAAPTGRERLLAMAGRSDGTTISDRVDAAQRYDPVTTQDYIDMWRDRINANPGAVLDSIGLVPTDNGYMIAEQHDSGVNRAGLKAGDIVTTLNGQPVGNIDTDPALYDAVAQSGMARIEVERDGRTIVMSFPLQ